MDIHGMARKLLGKEEAENSEIITDDGECGCSCDTCGGKGGCAICGHCPVCTLECAACDEEMCRTMIASLKEWAEGRGLPFGEMVGEEATMGEEA